jgi:cell division protease FtsH
MGISPETREAVRMTSSLVERRDQLLGKVAALSALVRQATRDAVRSYRRKRVAKRKTRSKQVYGLSASLIVLAALFVWCLSYLAPQPSGRPVTLDQLGALAGKHQLLDVAFRDQDAQIVGRYACMPPVTAPATPPANGAAGAAASSAPVPSASPVAQSGVFTSSSAAAPACAVGKTVGTFWVSYPRSDAATALLLQVSADSGARVRVEPQTRKAEVRTVTTLVLPLMLLANLFVLLFVGGKGGSSGIGEVETFSSIGKGRFSRKGKSPTTFADIAGADEAVAELREVRDYLADPEKYKEIGAQPPKGVLLIGPPGCGKTLLAKAVAGEVGVPFFSVAGAEFVESLVGVGAARVRDLFARVRSVAPAVVFIDELDAAGRKRAGGGASGGNEEREQTLNQILVEMDGFDVSSGIVVMAATNRPDILDPALLRPGRFDRHVTVDRPDLIGRINILELHARGKPMAVDVDLSYVARRTAGFSGADLANVINESALLAVRQGKDEIEMPDLEEAIQRSISGATRRGQTLTPDERQRAAYHEGGHVIVSAASGQLGELHRVSILASGANIGTTSRLDSEAALLTERHLQSRLASYLAGMAAEQLIFGDRSTGSERDVEQATRLAREMVARYAMSDRIGPVRLLAADVDGFLDAEVPLAAVSGQTHQELDAEVKRMLEEAKAEATRLLVTHRGALDALAGQLEAEETLEGADLEVFVTMVRPQTEMFGALISPRRGAAEPADAGTGRSTS